MVALLWIGFVAFVLVMLALDLGFFNRKAHVISTREALRWTGLCAALALVFTFFVYFAYEHHVLGIGAGARHTDGPKAALDFLQGYIIEMSLSLDNIFVIALIFAYFGVPRIYQHRVLFWGILGALIMRGIMIGIGVALVQTFEWILYFFGALLIYTAFKMLFAGEGKVEPDRNPLVRVARKLYPVSGTFEGEKFFTRIGPGVQGRGFPIVSGGSGESIPGPQGEASAAPVFGRRAITPLFVTLLVIESTDVLFAIDSIPAIFGITQDPFIVFTSNVFAILCLRSMYFALAGMLAYFHYLKYSLVALLFYIGMKMLITMFHVEIPAPASLAVIVFLLAMGIIASLLHPVREKVQPPDEKASEDEEKKPPDDDVGL